MAGLFLLGAVAVAAHELVYAACGVDEFLLAGEEGVRSAGDFKLHKGIGNTINLDSFAGGHGRTGDEDFVIRHVLENHFAIVGGMNVFFHFY